MCTGKQLSNWHIPSARLPGQQYLKKEFSGGLIGVL